RRHTRFSRDWSSDVCSSDLRSRRPTGSVGEDRTAQALPLQFHARRLAGRAQAIDLQTVARRLEAALARLGFLQTQQLRARELLDLAAFRSDQVLAHRLLSEQVLVALEVLPEIVIGN